MARPGLIRLKEAAGLCSIDSHTLMHWMGRGHARSHRAYGAFSVRREVLRRCLVRRGLPVPFELQGRPTVLVVDDDRDMRQVVAWTLRALWPEAAVATARDGDEAAEKLLNLRPDLLVTDLRMPGMDGMMLCAMAQKNRYLTHTKILALTGFNDPETRMEVFDSGAHEYLRKPFDPQELCDSAIRLLGIGPGMPLMAKAQDL